MEERKTYLQRLAAIHLYYLLRFLVMGYKLQYMDYPLSGAVASYMPQAGADEAEGCEEPRWELTVFSIGNQRNSNWRIRITAHCDASIRLAQFQDREEG